MSDIDFESYSTKELLKVFECVDDQLHPENALSIYKFIVERLQLKGNNNTCKELGYEEDLMTEVISHILLGSATTLMLFGDPFHDNQKIEEKMIRLNKRLDKKTSQ